MHLNKCLVPVNPNQTTLIRVLHCTALITILVHPVYVLLASHTLPSYPSFKQLYTRTSVFL